VELWDFGPNWFRENLRGPKKTSKVLVSTFGVFFITPKAIYGEETLNNSNPFAASQETLIRLKHFAEKPSRSKKDLKGF
jgi:hypothetical protein